MTARLVITVQHLYSTPGLGVRPGFCARGTRAWAAAHGLDWAAFVREGIDAELLERTGDALALRVVAHAREMEATRG